MNNLYGFNIRITGVKFEADDLWLMARPGKTPSTFRARMTANLPEGGSFRHMRIEKKEQNVTGSIEPMSVSLRPTIQYREKAQYTQEAKDNGVEGTVVLRCVFGVDGKISDITVIRGLPHGLTEKAIEAAEKIRFEPAVRDGAPVNVRGMLEYSFRLDINK